jgi:hypothetical protein
MTWHYEGWRHSLAAKGQKTYRKLNGKVLDHTKHGVPITMQSKPEPGKAYPVGPKEVKDVLNNIPQKDIKGLTEVNFRNPSPVAGSKQDKAWAQYVRSKKRINVFSQPYKNGKFNDVEPGNESPQAAKKHIQGYVLPHEVGHHSAAMKNPDLPIIVEEAKADAFAAHENPESPKVLEKHINHRIMMFGEKGTI